MQTRIDSLETTMASSSSAMEIDAEFLARLVTKADLAAAIAPLATKEELRALAIKEELKSLATKEELKPLATKEELQTLATKEDLKTLATRDEMLLEGERTRRHFDVVAERLESSIRLVAEGHDVLDRKIDDLRTELKGDIAGLDRRVTRLEARDARKSRR